jgi:hypothetical protein
MPNQKLLPSRYGAFARVGVWLKGQNAGALRRLYEPSRTRDPAASHCSKILRKNTLLRGGNEKNKHDQKKHRNCKE